MTKFIAWAAAGLVAALSLVSAPAPAHAQTTSATVVANCGTPPTTYSAGQNRQVTQGTDGRVCQTSVVSGNAASGTADSGSPIKVGCVFNTSPPTVISGNRVDCQADTNGGVRVSLTGQVQAIADGLAAKYGFMTGTGNAVGSNSGFLGVTEGLYNGTTVDVRRSIQGAAANGSNGLGVAAVEESGRPYTHVNSNTTVAAKAGKGFLHTLTVGTAGAAWTATLFDNTSGTGTVIGVFSLNTQVSLTLDVAFTTGLTIVTTGTTPGDVTLAVR